MKISSKIFFIGIIVAIAICSLIGLKVRSSIKDLEFKDVSNQSNEYTYDMFSARYDIQDLNIESVKNELESESELIVSGKFTGQRKILYGCVLSEVSVVNEYKGDVKAEYIYLYEPIDYNLFIDDINSDIKGVVFSNSGYGLMKENKEYIFFLKGESAPPEFDELKKSKESYTYVNDEFSKFSIEYNKNDYKVLKADDHENLYNEVIDYEQVFSNEEVLDFYNKVRETILNKYKI